MERRPYHYLAAGTAALHMGSRHLGGVNWESGHLGGDYRMIKTAPPGILRA